MADRFLNAHMALADERSFYHVLRKTGMGATPFWDSLDGGVDFKGNPKAGHSWGYTPQPTRGQTNAYAEGSRRADVTSYEDVLCKNHLQIFKKTSGITGSENEAWTVEKKKRSIRDQQSANHKQLRLDVELALISRNAPVAATTLATVRKMGGVAHYVPSIAIFNLGGGQLSVKNHIDEALKLMFVNGMSGERIILQAGADAYTETQHLYAEKRQLSDVQTTIGNSVTRIKSGWYPQGVELSANPNYPPKEIRLYAPNLIDPVLLRQHKNKKVSDPGYDSDATEDLIEMSVQVLDPFAMIIIENIGC